MITHQLVQGSPEWKAHRRQYFNASDAPAMLGCSLYKTRDQLLHEMHTGLAGEVDAGTQHRFDDGHRFEALARPLAAEIVGEALYPQVGSEGRYSASFDGLTMAEDTAFEHKSLNAELRACMNDQGTGYGLPKMYQVQMEHQLLVSGADRVLFMASKWDGETLVEERHCWYASDPKLRAELIAGWDQFDIDLAAYVPPAAAAPAPTGRAPETLPALLITVRGEVTDSNLANFKGVALTAIRSVNRDLKTDQDFADADKAVKWCDDIETRVVAAKEHALSQTQTIDQLFKTLDDIKAEARQVRLDLGKLITARKASLKTELLTDIQTQWADYLCECNKRIGKDYMPQIQVDFAGAIHGKKNFDSMRAALNTALANGKIEASAKADLIQTNMATLTELASEHKFLFMDTATIVLKANDDLTALVKSRIADHKAAELAKEEATRARIQAEEQAKAEAAARAKVLAEQETERLASEAAKPVVVADVAPAPQAVTAQQTAQIIPNIIPTLPAAKVVAMPTPVATPAVVVKAWETSEPLPEVPMQWVEVQEVNLYRFLPYKENSTEFKRGKKGRWQRHNGYGFDNAEPQAGPWRVTDGAGQGVCESNHTKEQSNG